MELGGEGEQGIELVVLLTPCTVTIDDHNSAEPKIVNIRLLSSV